MRDTVGRYLEGMTGPSSNQRAVRVPLENLADRTSSQALTSAGLVINGAGATFAKIGTADFYAVCLGKLVKVVAGTPLPALTGVVAGANQYVVACFFVDVGGNLTVSGSAAAATLSGVVFPQTARGLAMIGFAIITTAGGFTGGTTALDAGTTVYINRTGGSFDPTILA